MVMAFGNPYEQYFTMTRGIVSALGRSANGAEPLPEDFIQTDAAINPGNSGGALVNIRGQVIGVPTFILSGGGGPGGQGSFMGIGFAIPINMAKHIMTDLIKTGKVARGYLGLYPADLTSAMAKEFQVPDTNGALVQDVPRADRPRRQVSKQGTWFAASMVTRSKNADQLTIRVTNIDPGTTVTLGILRNGKPMDIRVTLGTRPANLTANRGGGENQQQAPPKSGALAGVAVQNLTPDIRQQLQLPSEVHGVVITGVDQNSPAGQYLTQGDVIESVNRQPVNNVADFDRLASEAKGQTLLRVVRQGVAMFIVISPGDEGGQ